MPSALMKSALQAGSTARDLSTTGAALGGFSQTASALYQSQVAANNAKLRSQDAVNAGLAGTEAEEVSRLKTGELLAREKTTQAGNNIDVNVGSAVDARNTTKIMGEMDAQLIRYNALKEQYGYGIEANNYRTQSALDLSAAGNAAAEGGLNVASTYIGGSNSLLNKSLAWKAVS